MASKRDRVLDRETLMANRSFLAFLFCGTLAENEAKIGAADNSELYSLLIVMTALASGDIPFTHDKFKVLQKLFKLSLKRLHKWYRHYDLREQTFLTEEEFKKQQEYLIKFAPCYKYLLGALFSP